MIMQNGSVLEIYMLGNFSVKYEFKYIDDNKRSMKLWTLLEYLLTFRNKKISQEELIELLWSDGNIDNPINALKTMIHRLRNVLGELGYVPGKDLIIQKRGSYTWNSDIPAYFDIDDFENLCREAQRPGASDEEILAKCMKAIDLYKGDFLPKSSGAQWATPVQAYYHSLYSETVKKALELLRKKERYDDIVNIATAALSIDPYDETLHYNAIYSLAKQKEIKAALKHYETMSDSLGSYFGIAPSENLAALYKEIVKSDQESEADLDTIKAHLQERDPKAGAFMCKYDFFKDIYQLTVRNAARTGTQIYLGVISAKSAKENVSAKSFSTTMSRMSSCIMESLRKGDVYSKCSSSQYILMLPSVSYEDGRMILERILNKYKTQYSRDSTRFSYMLDKFDQDSDAALAQS